jgi:trehalose monomycolate/heme transporter
VARARATPAACPETIVHLVRSSGPDGRRHRAALLLMIMVGPFALSSVTITKMMGASMIVALVVDTTVIRVLLVPATMKLLGRANWWAPAPLRRLHDRMGIDEGREPTPTVSRPAFPVVPVPVAV